jgi:hypothetical protein
MSTVEELQCLATWKEGSSRYLVGLVHHSHATSNEDRYRCFVYEKATEGSPDETVDFWVAQSGDATCNGLFTPMEGSRTMTLRKGICNVVILIIMHHILARALYSFFYKILKTH